ncbi:hypothetical protein ACLOJK_030177 [Asimina triloba]
MASSSFLKPLSFLLALSSLQCALGEIICENLPKDVCAFSISSTGKRCSLENSVPTGGAMEYACKTSQVSVERLSDWIEADECLQACGADRNMVGISSDALMEPQFISKLCSTACYQSCPNIVDLYFNLAAGEGVFLPDLCELQRTSPHRALAEFLSSGAALSPEAAAADSSYFASAPDSAYQPSFSFPPESAVESSGYYSYPPEYSESTSFAYPPDFSANAPTSE